MMILGIDDGTMLLFHMFKHFVLVKETFCTTRVQAASSYFVDALWFKFMLGLQVSFESVFPVRCIGTKLTLKWLFGFFLNFFP